MLKLQAARSIIFFNRQISGMNARTHAYTHTHTRTHTHTHTHAHAHTHKHTHTDTQEYSILAVDKR